MNINWNSNDNGSYQIDLTKVKRIEITEDMFFKLTEEQIAEIPTLDEFQAAFEKSLEAIANGTLIPDNAPENLYAEIKVNGEVVATVWKSGGMMTANKYRNIAEQSRVAHSVQERVDFLAKAFGGEISYYNNNKNTPAYSISDSLAKILANQHK